MTTVFIAGCFDGLHSAHLSILSRSRALGDRLIVGLNDDADLARKGPGRPIDTWQIRAQKLADTGLVYCVDWFAGSPLDLILEKRPDIITVGDDYTVESTVGYPECLKWGGKIVILPRTPGISTTDLIAGERQIWQGIQTK